MEVGWILDHSEEGRKISNWMEGLPERGLMGLKLRGRKALDVESWRCKRCGYLENYAPG